MAEVNELCACCGKATADRTVCGWGEIDGARFSSECASISSDKMIDRILARRRSEAGQGAVGPLSAEGRPIAVGDRVAHKSTGRVIVVNRINGADVGGPVQYEAGDPIKCMDREGETRDRAERWRHLAPAAQPAEKAKGDGVPAEWRQHIGKRVQRVDFPSTEWRPGVFVGSCNGGSGATIRRDDGYEYACPWTALKLIDDAKTPGGSAYAAPNENDAPKPKLPDAPQPDLAAFTAAVEQHLLPRLPKGWKAITDSVAGEMWLIWILDAKGAEVHFAQYGSGWDFTDGNAAAISTVVAERILARMSRAAEKPRGGGR